ncbi:DVUA0089 family protein [Nitrosospira multiformis]|uniref:PEP-CTERM protein-sorting domain-containing protein n=1 Tax=Nitrosospira multiformis TaxID=1231 RepID=A0A1I7IAE2_9PROT|nr:DVUA0089 family protein [Nitrosospira multiformis]SFU69806.1 PEP-CTERM protein-sorting domain-containing protein [Nitrosospira multiformis]
MIQRTILAFSLSAIAMSSHAGFYNDSAPPPPISSFATATDINPYFTTEFSPDIGNSFGNNTSLEGPWVTIAGKGNDANDYFSFDVSKEDQGVRLDIDYTASHPSNPNGFDSQVALWRQVDAGAYSLVGANDDFLVSAGAGGSVDSWDSFLSAEAPVGHYIAGVTRCCIRALDTGWAPGSNGIPNGLEYTLQVQVGEVEVTTPIPEPETYAMLLAGLGLLGFMARRKNNTT